MLGAGVGLTCRSGTAPFCVLDRHYTAQAGNTCNFMALANSVSSEKFFYAATAAGATRCCNDLPADLTTCLPFT
ncbi:hypothetical protein CKAH01_15930 [Colletotrichum kahawae]|uniref:Uncharacterized protein n=1 Tax=Colletotrichum kahawae TaxID=34407 RepID=A0AAD9YER9_COLKA|nr:hypothetical protein CKAH01_15930 [Colletotrichum kahawae]